VLKWLFATLLLQHTNRSQQAASRARRVISASLKVTQVVGDTCYTRCQCRRYSRVIQDVAQELCYTTFCSRCRW